MNIYLEFIFFAVIICYIKIEADAKSSKPHIVYILADDLGWNDVSHHGSPQIPTPNIDALAMNGVTLHNMYAEQQCTPSRGALMSGDYPIRLGMQADVFKAGEESGLPLNYTLLPQYLKGLGYRTHMIGKWHLGYMSNEYTPPFRGFDSFFGYYNGLIDYYDFTVIEKTELPTEVYYFGVDLHNGTNHIREMRSRFAVDVFTEAAVDIIHKHDTDTPLFLFYAEAAVHSGNLYGMPEQAPPELVQKFRNIQDYNRRIHAARTWALDQSVGSVFQALDDKDMLDNVIFVFSSDNGGEIGGFQNGYSSNYPLRGRKETVWEGGVRIPALVWSPLLENQEPRISNDLMHIVDWLPTLYTAAGGNASDLGRIDGLNQWETISKGAPGPRNDFLYNIDPLTGFKAYQKDGMKIMIGSDPAGYNLWYGPTGFEYNSQPQSMETYVFQNGSVVKDILQDQGWWVREDADSWYSELVLNCTQPPPNKGCDASKSPCLFNITADPCEYTDLSEEYPEILDSLMQAINDYQAQAVPPQTKPSSPNGDPMCAHFMYVPFVNPGNSIDCNVAYNTVPQSQQTSS